MRRNYKPKKLEPVKLESYLKIKKISLEDIITALSLDNEKKINLYLESIGIEKQDSKQLKNILSKLKKRTTEEKLDVLKKATDIKAVSNEEKSSRKSTRSKKLNVIDNVDSMLKKETEFVSSDLNEK